MMNLKWWQDQLPKLVLSPSCLLIMLFVYGFIIYTGYLSFTDSRMFPSNEIVGFSNYDTLFQLRTWKTALVNLGLFGGLYIGLCLVIGLSLAIFLDQKIRGEGVIRPIFLYPMALSFIVTGTAWKWIMDPGIGIEPIVQGWGFDSFEFRWIKDRSMAIYCVVIAGVWQTSGFVMAMFLAGLRGIDPDIVKASKLDGAPTIKLYQRIIIPMLRPIFLSAFVVLAHMAIKSYDLVVALTNGGPGNATALPATFMYSYTFTRNQMGIGASSAVVMLMTIAAIIVPYLYSELRHGGKKNAQTSR